MKIILSVLLFIPVIIFSQEQRSIESTLTSQKENKIYEEVEKEASYPGGLVEMKQFLAENIVYPEEGLINNDQGKVFIEFIVNTDGSIEGVKTLRGVSEEINNEAMRVISIMPNWIPAEFNGEKVRARCRVPINFILEKSNRKFRKEARRKAK